MSTDEYEPSDPPTIADWQYLAEKAKANRRRGKRAVAVALAAVVIGLSVLIGAGAVWLQQKDVPQLVRQLERSNEERTASSKTNDIVLATIVEGLATAFATPPFPDPGRVQAVQGLCGTAKAFRAAAGDTAPPPCPAVQ